MYEILTNSIGDSKELRHAGPEILKGNFEVGFALELAFKDLDLALQTGRESFVPLPLTAALRETFGFARARGRGQSDCRAVITVLEEACGVEVRAAPPSAAARQEERTANQSSEQSGRMR
jgi:3-hydroxyisobutyrate dehydrogenase-like beta-hydroxyacid dehydrogenase